MKTPRHLRQKILHGTFALFPLIDTCWNQFGYIVSTFSPCGLDLATLVSCPFPYGVMQETLFPTSSVSGKYNNHAAIPSFRSPWSKRRCFYPYAQRNCHFVGCYLPSMVLFCPKNIVSSKISVCKCFSLNYFL